MAKQNRTTLKGYFETGNTPSQAQYADLIDSKLNLSETGIQIVAGTVSSSILESSNNIIAKTHVTASGNISASGTISTGSLGSLKVMGSSVDFSGLPTSDPGVTGRLYNDLGIVKISL